ncbi:MAG TPA: hypothetical protein VFA83_00170 [Acidimicrobiales bacterium]|nr:hypothetical protein [Acidimicrobiales bacterium]
MTTDEAASRTRVGFAAGAAAVLASVNVVANFASQAMSDAGRRDVEALFSNLGVREAKRAAAEYVHLHHERATRSLVLGAVLLLAFIIATRPAVASLGWDAVRWWTLPAALVGGLVASFPIWWLSASAGLDLTWAQEIAAVLAAIGVVVAVWARFGRE